MNDDQANQHPDLTGRVKEKVKGRFGGFITFVREQGVVGLAIGFILGGAVSSTVASFVTNIINPLIGVLTGKVDLAAQHLTIGPVTLNYGAFLSSFINLVIVSAVVYFIFQGLGIVKLDKKKSS